ncbi:C1 family peptidase [Planktothrix agardhii]|uniref:C1 family peptidase n=1 Tax=Planktothrix agardhii TaxID=1160 RepID=UPI0028AEA21C|nr:C1 family peptidase [Planktothrix agardhii]
MELNKHPLGWLPDYPDWRDITMNNISENIVKDKSLNQENTESPIRELAKLIIDNLPDQNLASELQKTIDKFNKKDENEIEFLNVKSENKVFLYRGSRNDKITNIQSELKYLFYDDQNKNNACNFSGNTKEILVAQKEDFLLELEKGYFGEATHEIMICFKKTWELPSESSIIDCDFNPKQTDTDKDNYEYKPGITIEKVLNTIVTRIKAVNQGKGDHAKIGDCDSEPKLTISKIKESLETMGYFDFSKDVNYEESKYFFGYKTDLVVEFFQGINNLYPDGIVGQRTQEKLQPTEETITKCTNSKDLAKKLDGNPMVYLQKKLYYYFGCEDVKFNGDANHKETIDCIGKVIGEKGLKTITMDSLKGLLQKIIDQAYQSKQYSLAHPLNSLNFYEDNKNKNCSDQKGYIQKKDCTLLRIQEPISQNIIKIFIDKLKLKLEKHQKDSITITEAIVPLIYPVIKLVIKKISDLGIHGQLDSEQAISQAIDLINIILAKKSSSSSSSKNADKEDRSKSKGDESLNNYDYKTNFFLEFMRGKRNENSEINLILIYESLSAKEKQEIDFLIFITLDKIESMIDQKKEGKDDFTHFIEKSKGCFKNTLKKEMSKNSKLDRNPTDSSSITNQNKNNQTILQILDQKKDPKQLSVPIMSKIKENSNSDKSLVYLCLPEFVDLSYWCSPVKNQEPLNSCTACAAITLVEYFQNRTADKYTNASVLFLYKVARKLMLREGDVGASIRETMKALVLFGIPPEEYWPYEPSKIDEEPTGFCYSYAQNYQAIQYFRLDTAGLPLNDLLAQIKMTLVAGLPSMFGLTIYSSIYEDANYKRGYIPIPNQKDHVEGGHALVAIGYDDHKIIGYSVGAFLVINSWGTKWGEKGYGWLPYDYIIQGLTSDWWSLVKAEWFETMNFGLGANDWKHNNNGEPVPDPDDQ